MIDSITRFLKRVGSILLVILALIVIVPVAAEKILGIDLSDLRIFRTRVVDLPGENFQTVISEIASIDRLILAEYRGVTFLRETITIRLLGIGISDIDIWKHIPGVVRASINLEGYDLAGNVAFGDGLIHLTLPQPTIDTCELLFDQVAEGQSMSVLPLESKEDIALVEDSMYQEARTQLIEKALDAGILDLAMEEARSDITAAVQAIYGASVSVQVDFVTGNMPIS